MNTTLRIVLAIMGGAAPALAANGTMAWGGEVLTTLFLAFAAFILVFQMLPALVLFASMLRGLFGAKREPEALPARNRS